FVPERTEKRVHCSRITYLAESGGGGGTNGRIITAKRLKQRFHNLRIVNLGQRFDSPNAAVEREILSYFRKWFDRGAPVADRFIEFADSEMPRGNIAFIFWLPSRSAQSLRRLPGHLSARITQCNYEQRNSLRTVQFLNGLDDGQSNCGFRVVNSSPQNRQRFLRADFSESFGGRLPDFGFGVVAGIRKMFKSSSASVSAKFLGSGSPGMGFA